jgi:hypothetical protein
MAGYPTKWEGTIASAINRQTNEQGSSDREARLAMFVEQVPAAIAMFDTEMRFLAVSRRFLARMTPLFSTGVFAPADIIGRGLYEIYPNSPQHWRDIHGRVTVAGEELAEEEECVQCTDGKGSRGFWTTWLR